MPRSTGGIYYPDHPLTEIALDFATECHKAMGQKYDDEWYIVHPEFVAFLLQKAGYSPVVQAGALVHDVPEDTGRSVESLLDDIKGVDYDGNPTTFRNEIIKDGKIPLLVVKGIAAVTAKGLSREEKVALAKTDPFGQVLKYYDASTHWSNNHNKLLTAPDMLISDKAEARTINYNLNVKELYEGLYTPEQLDMHLSGEIEVARNMAIDFQAIRDQEV